MATQIVGGRAKSTAQFMNETTAIDCQKQVRSWRLVRSYMELLVPSCGCYCPPEQSQEEEEEEEEEEKGQKFSKTSSVLTQIPKHVAELPTIVTGTIFGFRHGKVSLCIQPNHRTAPIVLLGLAVPSAVLAREMQSGLLRIALHCNYFNVNNNARNVSSISTSTPRSLPPLMSMPLWTVYCNGRKAGFAVKRRPTKSDVEVLRLMQSVAVGAGSINRSLLYCEDDELIYLRANFERVSGFAHSLSFHLINPDRASTGQELSIFFLRS